MPLSSPVIKDVAEGARLAEQGDAQVGAVVLDGVGCEPLVLPVVECDYEGAVHVANYVALGAAVAVDACVDGGNDERKEYYKRVVRFQSHN